MQLEWVLRIVLFGIVHWILAGIMLQDLANRERAFGGKKAPWAIAVIIIPCFGSLIYLAFHPDILNPDISRGDRDRRDRR